MGGPNDAVQNMTLSSRWVILWEGQDRPLLSATNYNSNYQIVQDAGPRDDPHRDDP